MNTIVWFRIWFLSVTPYGICLALAVLLMNRVAIGTRRSIRALRGFHPADCMWIAVPLGMIGAKLFHWVFSFGSYSFIEALALWRGGYAMSGAWLGFIFGVSFYSRRRKFRLSDALDCFAAALCLFVLTERLAEGFTDQGFGKGIDTPFLQHTLFSMTDEYGTARHAVYRLEALSAAIALLCVIRLQHNAVQRHFRVHGEAFRMALFLIAAPQIVWESMRDDGYLSLTFVRVQQGVSLACVLGLFIFYCKRLWHTSQRSMCATLTAITILCVALIVRQEFAVDSNGNLELNYLLMMLGVGIMAACVLKLRSMWLFRLKQAQRGKQRVRHK